MSIHSASVYTDFSGLAELKAQAREDQSASIDKAAKQFESLFMNMMLKSMRDATPKDSLFNSHRMEFAQEMYDKQLSIKLSESDGIGLADVIKRQLSKHQGIVNKEAGESTDSADQPVNTLKTIKDYFANPRMRAPMMIRSEPGIDEARKPSPITDNVREFKFSSAEEFVEQLMPYAEKAAEKLGIEPVALLAQAALETGWGKHLMKHLDGSQSHNLFGIKADARWSGDKVSVSTLEYEKGIASRQKAQFRSYESFEKSFDDYVDFILSNPRYESAVQSTGDIQQYFRELQRAGYATDPKYAEKIQKILDGNEILSSELTLNKSANQPIKS